jgi:hypothetical protein
MRYKHKTARAFYKKLLTLYPPAFREQFEESMEQTFNDLYNEQKQQTGQGLFRFVLWIIVETATGIVQEHILVIKEMNPMNTMLTHFRPSAIIGFLIILPFILLELAFVILKKLTFDLRDALDSVVIFGILWLGVAAILLILMPIVRNLRQAGKDMRANPAQGNTVLTNSRSAALIGFLLALPFLAILSLLLLHIEPPFAHLLNNPDPDQPNLIGTLIALGAFLLAIAACLISGGPIVRTMQAGGSLLSHPINLIVVILVLSFITMLVVSLTVDQFPCWVGVPNCD